MTLDQATQEAFRRAATLGKSYAVIARESDESGVMVVEASRTLPKGFQFHVIVTPDDTKDGTV